MLETLDVQPVEIEGLPLLSPSIFLT